QVFLTYPFVDAAVGNNPTVARNLHMGDYTNLSARLDLSLSLPSPVAASPPITTLALPVNCTAAKNQVNQAVNTMVNGYVKSAIKAVPVLTNAQKNAVRTQLTQRLQNLVAGALASIDCKNPQATVDNIARLLNKSANQILNSVLKTVLSQVPATGAALKKLCQSNVGHLLPAAQQKRCKSLVGGVGGGGGGLIPPVNGGAGGGGLIGSLPRTGLGTAFTLPRSIDPFGVGRHGYDPGLSTLLLQGVATR
ncbi:MAG: hypothetical protein M3Z50_12180, partial [Actinomycetota bacterium]|nr:hypothetical protein [Actinomycetota bacterium]